MAVVWAVEDIRVMPLVPPCGFWQVSMLRPGIMEVALGISVRSMSPIA
jgi:hypothetical protein